MKNKNVTLTFFCVQPLRMDNVSRKKLFFQENKKRTGLRKPTKKPIWLENHDNFNDTFKSTDIIGVPSVDISLLRENLDFHEKRVGSRLLSDLLKDATHHLLFNHRLEQFTLIVEIVFEFPARWLEKTFVHHNDDSILTLYTDIRNILVKEEDSDELQSWAGLIHSQAIEFATKELSNISSIRTPSISIRKNTGNITNFIDMSAIDLPTANKLTKLFLRINRTSERVPSGYPPLDTITGKYYFNGRFHTITNSDLHEKYRYYPIQFHMQFMWDYLQRINSFLDQTYEDITLNLKDLDKNTRIINSLIEKVRSLVIYHEYFKLAIEADNELIFKNIETRWNIESTLTTTLGYIEYFKEHLEKIQNEKNNRANNKQNKALFIISFLQIFAIISVWADYLALNNFTPTDESLFQIFSIFNNPENLAFFNLYTLPSILILVSTILIVYIVSKK